jgi:hypothetical protein
MARDESDIVCRDRHNDIGSHGTRGLEHRLQQLGFRAGTGRQLNQGMEPAGMTQPEGFKADDGVKE